MAVRDGASLTGVTVSVKVSELLNVPSETVTVMFAVPFQSGFGTMLNVVPETLTVTSLEVVVAENVRESPSGSVPARVSVLVTSSAVV